ncbi:MAG: hypothetical protein ACR2M5_07415 [Nakamurella sp.]
MTPPSNGKAPVLGGTEASENADLLAGDQVDHNADSWAVVDAAWQQFAGLMLSAPPLNVAQELLEGVPTEAPDPALSWWLTGVRLSVSAGIIPSPITAADAAIRAGVKVPPGMRGLVLATGSKMVSDVTGTPMVCGADLAQIIRSGAVRRAVQIAGERLVSSAWRGDDDQLAELVKGEASALLRLAAEVTA